MDDRSGRPFSLRGKKSKSIGFLVPLILNDRIQNVFASAVEGSQHPRFKEDVLLNIAIPKSLLALADEISSNVARNVLSIRQYETSMSDDVKSISKFISFRIKETDGKRRTGLHRLLILPCCTKQL